MKNQYVLQIRAHDWDPWVTCREFETLEEARAAYDALPLKHGYRIAKAYVVVQYRGVKL